MARHFPNNDTNFIEIGDISTARFELGSTWSILAFVNVANTTLWKWMYGKGGDANTRQFYVVLDGSNALNVGAGGITRISVASGMVANAWYLIVVTNDGTGTSGGLTLDVFDMTGTSVASKTGIFVADVADLTGLIRIGRMEVPGLPMFGDLANICYTDFVVSTQDMLDYLRNPVHAAARFKTNGVQFFLPLNGSSPEVDWSGNVKNGIVNGTPTVADNPPVQSAFSFDTFGGLNPITSSPLVETIQAEGSAFHILAADTTGDNTKEIIYACFNGDIVCMNSSTNATIWKYSTGSFPMDFRFDDIDSDGLAEFFVASADGKVYAIDHDGSALWNFAPLSDSPPMNTVDVATINSTKYVFCGGQSRVIYVLNSSGTQVHSLTTTSLTNDRPVHFLRAGDLDADGDDEVVYVSWAGECLGLKPTDTSDITTVATLWTATSSGGNFIGDGSGSRYFPAYMDLIDLDDDGTLEIVLGSQYRNNQSVVVLHGQNESGGSAGDVRFRLTNSDFVESKITYHFTMVGAGDLSAVVNEDTYGNNLVIVTVHKIFIYDKDGNLLESYGIDHFTNPVVPFSGMFIDNDSSPTSLWLSSSPNGDDQIYHVNFLPGWNTEFEAIPRKGKMLAITNSLNAITTQISSASTQTLSGDNYTVMITESSAVTVPSLIQHPAVIKIVESLVPNYSHLKFTTQYTTAIQGSDSDPSYIWSGAGARSQIDNGFSDLNSLLAGFQAIEDAGRPFTLIVAHSGDPYLNISDIDAILAKNWTNLVGFVATETRYDLAMVNLDLFLQFFWIPLMAKCKTRGLKVFMWEKNMWWASVPARAKFPELSDGTYKDVFIPSVEDSSSTTVDLNLCARLGLLASGAVNTIAARTIFDSTSANRNREWEYPMTGHIILRQMMVQVLMGCKVIDFHNSGWRGFDLTSLESAFSFKSNEGNVLLIHMLGKGLLVPPEPEDIVNLSPVVIRMRDPDTDFIAATAANIENFGEVDDMINSPFVKTSPIWGFANTDTNYIGNYLLGADRYWGNNIPDTKLGIPSITPKTASLTNYRFKVDEIWETDGQLVYGKDGTSYTGASAKSLILSDFTKARNNNLFKITGDKIFYVAQKLDTNKYRITLIDPGMLDPQDRNVVLEVNAPGQTATVTDLLSGEVIPETASWEITVNAGVFRILTVDLSAVAPITTGHNTKPVVKVGYNNEVYVAYERIVNGLPQIQVIGTKSPSTSLPVGVFEGKRIDDSLDYFTKPSDFIDIVTFSSGMNQLPDMFVDLNDVLHIVWQSNRDGRWEIYYANSENNFVETRITNHTGKSLHPSIHGDTRGRLYISWHDDRFGGYEIMMAYKIVERILPLSQQDPYMASLRNDYDHFTGPITFTITNNDVVVRCFLDLKVEFYSDRLLENKVLTISQGDWPFAFNVPNVISDTTTKTFDDFLEWICQFATIDCDPYCNQYICTSPEFDSTLTESMIDKINITLANIDIVTTIEIAFRGSNIQDDDDAETQWTEYMVVTSGEILFVNLLLPDGTVPDTVSGKYKQIRIRVTTADPIESGIVSHSINTVSDDDDGSLSTTPIAGALTWHAEPASAGIWSGGAILKVISDDNFDSRGSIFIRIPIFLGSSEIPIISKLQLQSSEDDTGTLLSRIWLLDIDDAVSWPASFDPNALPIHTTSSVSWEIPTTGFANTYDTSNISSLVSDFTSRANNSGRYMALEVSWDTASPTVSSTEKSFFSSRAFPFDTSGFTPIKPKFFISSTSTALANDDGYLHTLEQFSSWFNDNTLVLSTSRTDEIDQISYSRVFMRIPIYLHNLQTVFSLNAFLVLVSSQTIISSDSINFTIYLLDISDASSLDWTNHSPGGFDEDNPPTRTTTSVSGSVGNTVTNTPVTLADIKDLVLEFISRSDYQPGNSIGIEIVPNDIGNISETRRFFADSSTIEFVSNIASPGQQDDFFTQDIDNIGPSDNIAIIPIGMRLVNTGVKDNTHMRFRMPMSTLAELTQISGDSLVSYLQLSVLTGSIASPINGQFWLLDKTETVTKWPVLNTNGFYNWANGLPTRTTTSVTYSFPAKNNFDSDIINISSFILTFLNDNYSPDTYIGFEIEALDIGDRFWESGENITPGHHRPFLHLEYKEFFSSADSGYLNTPIDTLEWVQGGSSLTVGLEEPSGDINASIFLRFPISKPEVIPTELITWSSVLNLTSNTTTSGNATIKIHVLSLNDASTEDWSTTFDITNIPNRNPSLSLTTSISATISGSVSVINLDTLIDGWISSTNYSPGNYIGLEIEFLTSTGSLYRSFSSSEDGNGPVLNTSQEINVLNGSDGWTESPLIPIQSWIQPSGTLVVARNQSGVARESSIFLRFKVSVPNLVDLVFAAIHLTPAVSSVENLNTRIYLLDLEDASQEDWSSSGFDVNALPVRSGAVVDWTIGSITKNTEIETPSMLSIISAFMSRSDFNPDKYMGIEIAWDKQDLTSISLFEFNDDFDRTDFGSDWNTSGSAVIDGTRVHSSSSTAQCIYTSALLSTNYEVSVDFYLNFTIGASETVTASIFLRKSDNVVPFSSATYYEIKFEQSHSTAGNPWRISLRKSLSGVVTDITVIFSGFGVSSTLDTFLDHRYSVFVETKENSVDFDLYQDGVFIVTLSDSLSNRILSGQYVGFQVEDLAGDGTKSSSANNFTARDTVGTSDLFKTFYATENNTSTPWLEIRVTDKLPLDIYWPIDTLTVTSISPFRLCLAPGESVTGTLDLTPTARIDKFGAETGEIPLPIQLQRNNTYFIRLLGVDSLGAQDFVMPQNTSVSCSECSNKITTWNFESCSLKFTIINSFGDARFFNLKCIFYYDKDKKQKAAEFIAFPDNIDLKCFTLGESIPAESAWTNRGHLIAASDQRVIVLWPHLSPTAGLICGIEYHVDIFVCSVFENLSGTICNDNDLEINQTHIWRCNCESVRWDTRFENAPVNIREISQWKSSGSGLSDTRITESVNTHNLNPVIRMRSTFNGVIVYETNRTSDSSEVRNETNINTYKVYASVFAIIPNYNMYASGAQYIHTESNDIVHRSDIPICKTTASTSGTGYQAGANCFDEDGNRVLSRTLEGRNIALEVDHYDRLFLSMDQLNDQELCEVFEKGKQSTIIVHRGGADDLDLFPEPTTAEEIAEDKPCTPSVLTEQNFAITAEDDFFNIIQQIRVHGDDIKYHTTYKGILAPVVGKCDITLIIVGTPESVAVHLKNNPGDDWSEWHAFEPKIGENVIEIEWAISKGSGVKNVHIQVSTYTGITQTAILIIISDYISVNYSVSFFKPLEDTPFPSNPLQSFEDVDNPNIWIENNMLNDINNIPVAALRPTITGDSDFIFVEIIPNIKYMKQFKDISDDKKSSGDISPTFDFIQQGSDGIFRSTTTYHKTDEGIESFRSYIIIHKNDNSMFVDGFASIVPSFRNDCSNAESLLVGQIPESITAYKKDIYNIMTPDDKSKSVSDSDFWSGERTEIGQIKNPVVIRPNEDPYLIFGDPKYRLRKENENN